MSISISIVSTENEFYTLHDEWESINNQCKKGNIFTSWEWLYQWWETFQNDAVRQLYILAVYDKKKLVGLAPFQIVTQSSLSELLCPNQLMMLGTGEIKSVGVFSEYTDIIILPSYENVVMDSLSEFLFKNKQQWHGVTFSQLLESSNVSTLFESYPTSFIKTVKQYGFRSLVDLPDSFDNYLMGLNGKVRGSINRYNKRIDKELGSKYKIKTVKSVDEIEESLKILVDLSLSRRVDKGDKSVFRDSTFVNFHREVLNRLVPLGKAIFRVTYLGNEPIAANYALAHGETLHGYQCGFERETGRKYSTLMQLIMHEISEGIKNEKLKHFNFMFSDDESDYKKKYTHRKEKMYNISYFHNSLRGKMYLILHGPIKEFFKNHVLTKLEKIKFNRS